ncbi:MAG: glycogen/starch synthase [Spirochaetes bacterium]|nr:glycogen/starch synthase [Spirochaetota bacterium]
MKILIAAAENDALIGGKIGGIGDVIRDVPPMLSKNSLETDVIVPSYGFLHKVNKSELVQTVSFIFGNKKHTASIYKVKAKNNDKNVNNYVIDHTMLSTYNNKTGKYSIYSNDPPDRPFATDAIKFAFFCTALAEAVKQKFFKPDIIHLHDWHTAILLILLNYHINYKTRKKFKIVFTIHNLALQGVRPFDNDESSLASWFGSDLDIDNTARRKLSDPRWDNCFNPMAIGIRYSDMIHTVSPTYAQEILKPDNKPVFYGGEGLEKDLNEAYKKKRLVGILNGCDYPENYKTHKKEFKDLIQIILSDVEKMISKEDYLSSANFIAYNRLKDFASKSKPEIIASSISRITEQKMLLLMEAGSKKKTGLENILDILSDKGLYIILGTGEKKYERFFVEMSFKYKNFIFINGYSESSSKYLYSNHDIFLMPSTFEPCGISQMLSMRDGKPCLVHEVGGLKDTVKNGFNGFSFSGRTLKEQVDNLCLSFKKVVEMKLGDQTEWENICLNAKNSRFLWKDSVDRYIKELYNQI